MWMCTILDTMNFLNTIMYDVSYHVSNGCQERLRGRVIRRVSNLTRRIMYPIVYYSRHRLHFYEIIRLNAF
jgi:hypothetical protein